MMKRGRGGEKIEIVAERIWTEFGKTKEKTNWATWNVGGAGYGDGGYARGTTGRWRRGGGSEVWVRETLSDVEGS